jgi:large subunit ribosomal protein L13
VGSNPIGPAKIKLGCRKLKLTEQTRSVSRESALRDRKWVLIDATDRPLGRIASRAASVLRGKHRPDYTPHEDAGDFVVVINADKVKLTGAKGSDKVYHRHTTYPGGIRSTTAGKLLAGKPERLIEMAVRGMLPKNRLGRQLFLKLKIYRGTEHPHAAQNPQPISL